MTDQNKIKTMSALDYWSLIRLYHALGKGEKTFCVTTGNYLTGNILECTNGWTKTCFGGLLLQVFNG